MLSCSLDPDQDLQTGSKLFTWYDVCYNIRGGGLCPSCKIQQVGLCPSCKIQRGGLCPSCKIHGGDFVTIYKNEQGGFCPGGDFVLHSHDNASLPTFPLKNILGFNNINKSTLGLIIFIACQIILAVNENFKANFDW